MVSAKRKRSEPSDSDTDLSDFSIEDARSEDEMDISSALTGKRTKLSSKADALEYGDDGEDDDDLPALVVKTGLESIRSLFRRFSW